MEAIYISLKRGISFVTMLILVTGLLFLNSNSTFASVEVLPAQGGDPVCANFYTTLGDIDIIERSAQDFGPNQTNTTLILTVPAGYEFKAGTGSILYAPLMDVTSVSMVVNTNNIVITLSVNGAPHRRGDQLRITGLQVRAIAAAPTAPQGNIMRTSANPGTFNISGIVLDATNLGTLTQRPAMAFTSATITQNNTLNIDQTYSNNEIIGIKITVTGTCSALNLSSLTFNTTGSTDPAGDIATAKVFYTFNSNVFNTAFSFGSTAAPSGVFNVTGSQTLMQGDNYFWLAYDIKPGATIGDFVDAECTSLTLSGVPRVPTPTAPAGNRQIGIITIVSNGTGGGVWDLPTTWVGGVVPGINNHVEVRPNDLVIMNVNTSTRNVTVNSGTLILGVVTWTTFGDVNTTGTGAVISSCNTTLSVQDIDNAKQFVLPAGIASLKKLSMNRSSGLYSDHNLDLSLCVPADSIVLDLKNGPVVFMQGKKLLLNSIKIQAKIISSDISYVDGIVSRAIPAFGTMYLYPVGNNGLSREFGVEEQGGGTGFHEVQFFYTQPPNFCCVNYVKLPGGITDKYYWRHTYNNPGQNGANPKRRIYYQNSDFPDLTPAQRTGALTLANNSVATPVTKWTVANTPWFVNDAAGQKYAQFHNANNANEEYWTFGSTDPGAPLVPGILPVDLVSFEANVVNQNVVVTWATGSETNSDYFNIQRSEDGRRFETVTSMPAAGFSTVRIDYTYTDRNPIYGISYYRLQQVDIGGSTRTYDPLAVSLLPDPSVFSVYPNPADAGSEITMNLEKFDNKTVVIEMFDILGNRLYSMTRKVDIDAGYKQRIVLGNQIPKGVYILTADDSRERFKKKIVVR